MLEEPERCMISVDVGTGSARVSVFGANVRLLAATKRPITTWYEAGQVHGENAHPTEPQREQEDCIAGEPVELGNEERRAGDPREVQRAAKFRPVRMAD